MSIHSSLRGGRAGGLKHRNVLTRIERMEKLTEDGRWNENANSMFALPKVRSIKVAVKKKKKEADDSAAKKK